MPNSYFNHTNRASANTLITDDQYNDGLDAVETGFDQFPDPTDLNNGLNIFASAVATGNSYDSTITSVTSYSNGLTVRIEPDTTNTGPAQFQINTLGYITVKRDNLSTLESGDLVATSIYTLSYSTNASAWILQTAPASIVSEAAAIYDDFDDRYLGPKAIAPSSDNDGNTLIVGAIYFDTTQTQMFVYTGTTWIALNTYTKYIADTPPSSPYQGQEWFDTSVGIDYTWYEDGDSGQWLQQTFFADAASSIIIDVNTSLTTTSVTATGSLDINTNVNFVDATSGNLIGTLPTAVGNLGSFIHVKRVDSSVNTVTIDTTGSETIDNFDSLTLAENQNLMVISDGANWRIL